MIVVTLCGRMRFAADMKNIARDLEIDKGCCVLQCAYNEEQKSLDDEAIRKLTIAHYKKIDISDAIYVVNIGGYIGESVKSEIAYAVTNGKEVIYHENR